MNHIYRVVFNRSLGVYQCVSELAKTQGKSSGRSATKNKQSSILFSGLSIALLGMAVGSTAQATTYSNGETTISNYQPIDDVIENTGTILNANDTNVGVNNIDGKLTIRDGGAFNNTNNLYIGRDSQGEVTVTGTGSTLSSSFAYLYDSDTLMISDGGQTNINYLRIGNYSYMFDVNNSNGFNKLTVTGTDSKLTAQNIYLYGNGNTLTIDDGGQVDTDYVEIGSYYYMFDDNNSSNGSNTLTVTGTDSKLTAQNIYLYGNGNTLTIDDGGQVDAKFIYSYNFNNNPSSTSTVNFDNGTLKLRENASGYPLFYNFTASEAINLEAGGGTIDTNGNNVSVFNSAVIKGIGSFTKAGEGTLTMNTGINKAWSGATNINRGVLQLNGDYTMVEGEVLGIGLNSIDDYGQLVVNGNANITEGQLNINASEAVQRLTSENVWSEIVKANTLTGEFKTITDNSQLVNFLADYSTSNAVNLSMVRQDKFVDTIQSQASRTGLSLAAVLDRSIDNRLANNNDEFADTLISSTIGFDQPQVAAAVNELQPLLMGASNRIVTDANIVISNAITEHSLSSSKRGLWAQALGSNIDQDEEDGVTGYDADSYGGIVGIDAPINSNLSLGMAVSYNDSDVHSDSQNLNHKMSAKSWQVLGYGNYDVSDATQVNFHAGAGRSNIEGERQLSILTDAVAQSDYDMDTLQAGFGIGHRIGTQDRNITPFAQVNYAQAKSDSYRETGAGVYNFEVDENTYESMRWTAGIKLSQALTPKVALTGQLAAAIENGDQRSDITASFISVPDDKFTTVGQEVSQEIGIAGIGISYMPTANMTLSAGYRGEWRDNYDDQGGNVALQIAF
ncbi:autotransporter domain-containing protein [Psychrobacter sp.]|uniref:autotransporter domain-containing protein n=1 Tax=Psychrobacter sp. TaxID=56811 RepID=UPI003568048E